MGILRGPSYMIATKLMYYPSRSRVSSLIILCVTDISSFHHTKQSPDEYTHLRHTQHMLLQPLVLHLIQLFGQNNYRRVGPLWRSTLAAQPLSPPDPEAHAAGKSHPSGNANQYGYVRMNALSPCRSSPFVVSVINEIQI